MPFNHPHIQVDLAFFDQLLQCFDPAGLTVPDWDKWREKG
jgi:hypothetical protein